MVLPGYTSISDFQYKQVLQNLLLLGKTRVNYCKIHIFSTKTCVKKLETMTSSHETFPCKQREHTNKTHSATQVMGESLWYRDTQRIKAKLKA
jgi:hypothetical protein